MEHCKDQVKVVRECGFVLRAVREKPIHQILHEPRRRQEEENKVAGNFSINYAYELRRIVKVIKILSLILTFLGFEYDFN